MHFYRQFPTYDFPPTISIKPLLFASNTIPTFISNHDKNNMKFELQCRINNGQKLS